MNLVYQNQLDLASEQLFSGKRYDELDNEEQIKLFEYLRETDALAEVKGTMREMDQKKMNSKKKEYPNPNDSSPEFKQLGYLHRQERNIDYWPQENSLSFRSNQNQQNPAVRKFLQPKLKLIEKKNSEVIFQPKKTE